MLNIFKMAFILFAVAALASGLLAYFYDYTKPQIAKIQLQAQEESKKYVIPEATSFKELALTEIENEKFYEAYDQNQNLLGYIFIAKGVGFSGILETMVGLDKEFKILNIKVIKQTETPGLGAECQTIKFGATRPYFEEYFKGKNSRNVVVEKDDANSQDKIQSITGSTITTRAICVSISRYAKALEKSIMSQTTNGDSKDLKQEMEQ